MATLTGGVWHPRLAGNTTRFRWFIRFVSSGPHLMRSCRTFSATLTTSALDRSSSRWFRACPCRPAPGAIPIPHAAGTFYVTIIMAFSLVPSWHTIIGVPFERYLGMHFPHPLVERQMEEHICSSGLATPPCGVPFVRSISVPSSCCTGASSHRFTYRSIHRHCVYRSTVRKITSDPDCQIDRECPCQSPNRNANIAAVPLQLLHVPTFLAGTHTSLRETPVPPAAPGTS